MIKNTDYLKSKMLQLFAKYVTPKQDQLKTTITKPKFYIGLDDSKCKDKFSVLGKIVLVMIKYGLTISNPKDTGLTYTLIGEEQETLGKITEELSQVQGLEIEEGAR